MMPYLAKSLSSMSPKASHGHTTVMSVPRPSMPGMSSPNLKMTEQGGEQSVPPVHDFHGLRKVPISFAFIKKKKKKADSWFAFSPLLAWFGGLALECAGLPLLELGWTLLGGGGASGPSWGQSASCRGAGVHFGCG